MNGGSEWKFLWRCQFFPTFQFIQKLSPSSVPPWQLQSWVGRNILHTEGLKNYVQFCNYGIYKNNKQVLSILAKYWKVCLRPTFRENWLLLSSRGHPKGRFLLWSMENSAMRVFKRGQKPCSQLKVSKEEQIQLLVP